MGAFNDEMRRLYGRESVFVMPRFATRVYFDVSLPSEAEAGMYGIIWGLRYRKLGWELGRA